MIPRASRALKMNTPYAERTTPNGKHQRWIPAVRASALRGENGKRKTENGKRETGTGNWESRTVLPPSVARLRTPPVSITRSHDDAGHNRRKTLPP